VFDQRLAVSAEQIVAAEGMALRGCLAVLGVALCFRSPHRGVMRVLSCSIILPCGMLQGGYH
jgi:hypothetical protein